MSSDKRLKRVLLVLVVASPFCGALALARMRLTGRATLLFLGWNLLLAWVPLLLSLRVSCSRPSPCTPRIRSRTRPRSGVTLMMAGCSGSPT